MAELSTSACCKLGRRAEEPVQENGHPSAQNPQPQEMSGGGPLSTRELDSRRDEKDRGQRVEHLQEIDHCRPSRKVFVMTMDYCFNCMIGPTH